MTMQNTTLQLRKPRKNTTGNILFKMGLWLYAMISLYPIIWMLFYSLKTNEEIFVSNPFGFPTSFQWVNYARALSEYNVPKYFFNSVIVSLGTVSLTILISLMFSYATSRMHWRGQHFARLFVSLGMFIPVQSILIPLAVLVKNLHLSNNYLTLILPYTAFNIAFSSMVFYGFLRSIPIELEEAAFLDGAGIFTTFFKIIVPNLKPAISTLIIFTFLQAWNEFPIALILITDNALKTLPLGLLFFQGQFTTDWGAMGAAMIIASFPTVVLYIFFSNQVEKAMTIGGAIK
ncbi:carbohydrate ABC transporter permease [Fusibacter sp. 3D3]|uniref:carbohydrate ABC transporter permease n=1 Tax=Fusibacter sp. 3D3 TaxID=1048380 RepID=UPI0008561F68|nr:carbohydrate ABC transporter permease [Fusibacter sp. 3D3]GAU79386.1 sugar ABC transporter permease [Fusibacter sp. 3D3]